MGNTASKKFPKYDEDIIQQILKLNIASNRSEIINAMDNVVNPRDINEIVDYINKKIDDANVNDANGAILGSQDNKTLIGNASNIINPPDTVKSDVDKDDNKDDPIIGASGNAAIFKDINKDVNALTTSSATAKVEKHDLGKGFYLVQSRYVYNDNDIPTIVGYSFKKGANGAILIEHTWKTAITRAVDIVTSACPGIKIVDDTDKEEIKHITITKHPEPKRASTFGPPGYLLKTNKVIIKLGSEWTVERRKTTALHELLHALGFSHEHVRNDAKKFGLTLDPNFEKTINEDKKHNWISADVFGATPYDPISIMNYQRSDAFDVDNDNGSWANSPLRGDDRTDTLSPLDAVGLNLIYKPCKRDDLKLKYEPVKLKINDTTTLYYCGRKKSLFIPRHIFQSTDGTCGPSGYPNCGACRVLKNDDIPKKNDNNDDVWQGWTGYFYCGKPQPKKPPFNDEWCGPNSGRSCKSCRKLMSK